jgi:hypothetical protein
MGATFRQRYGMTLTELVERTISSDKAVQGFESTSEDTGNVNLALTEATRQGGRIAGLISRVTRKHTSGEQVNLGSEEEKREQVSASHVSASSVVVLASGNLGLISFPAWKERMSLEQLTEAYPELLPTLIGHEGIAFALVHSETDGGVVIGKEGRHVLDTGKIVGKDPLSTFGAHAAAHLKRTDSFGNAPDILLNSLYVPETGEVAAFEELVGCHGGLGGTQTQPFVLFPVSFPVPEEAIVGAPMLHRVLKSWRDSDRAAAKVVPSALQVAD